MKRALIPKAVTIGALAAASALAAPAGASPPPGPESPPFNLEVILRDVAGGSGFGHVKFRQAVDGDSTGAVWLTLGEGLVPQPITTDDRGSGREPLFRDLTAVPTGMQFDIHFRVIDAETGAPVLASACHRFVVRAGHGG